MRKAIVFLVAVMVGYFVYDRFYSKPDTEEVAAVKALESRFDAAVGKFVRGHQQMGNLGMDTTADVESAVNQVRIVRDDLAELMKRLSEKAAVRRADEFDARIRDFYEKNSIE